MAYMPQGFVHYGANPVPTYTPPVPMRQISTSGPAAVPTPAANPFPGNPVFTSPYTSGQEYSNWLNVFGALGSRSRAAVPMSCIMGGIGCPATGMGDYHKVGDWEWMYNPPPYDFLDPAGVHPPPQFYAPERSMGMGGLGCGCGCSGGCPKGKGMGQATGTGLFGTTLFQTTDFTQWGWGEWLTIAAGGYIALNLFGDVKTVQKKVKRVRSRSRRKQKLIDEADDL